MILLRQKKGKAPRKNKGDTVDKMNGTYEVIINGETTLATTNFQQAATLFDFYRNRKRLFNIREIILLNAEQQFFFEG